MPAIRAAPTLVAMPDRRLSRMLELDDGTKLRTIDDAAKAIEKKYPPSLQWAPLTHALQLLDVAAKTGKPKDLDAATDQLALVLAISPKRKERPARPKPKRGA